MTQVKLDIENEAPDWVCLVCGAEGRWKGAHVTDGKRVLCPKCKEDGMVVTVAEAIDLDDYFAIRPSAKERMMATRKKLGYPTGKVRM
jgi:hypothetical protein